MTLPSRYGSSEYSAEAEVLFAEYVRRRAGGEELDFEAYCAAHPDHADELDGLHADWDNLHGLLGRMGVLGGLGDAAPELPTPGPAGPFVEEDPEAPQEGVTPAERLAAARARARLRMAVLVVCSVVLAVSLGFVARREARAAERLADQNRQLEGEVLARDERLVDLEASRLAAAELATAETARAERLAREALETAHRNQELAQAAADAARVADEESDRADAALREADAALRRAEEETARAVEAARVAAVDRLRADREQARAEEAAKRTEELERSRELDRRRAGAAQVALAAERLENGDSAGARRALDGVDDDLRNFAWRHLAARIADAPRFIDKSEGSEVLAVGAWRLADGNWFSMLRASDAPVAGIGWTAEGEVASVQENGALRVGAPDAGEAPQTLSLDALEELAPELAAATSSIAVHPHDGSRAEVTAHGVLELRDGESGALFFEAPLELAAHLSDAAPMNGSLNTTAWRVAFSADGTHLVAILSSASDGHALVWSLEPARIRAAAER